MASLKDILIRTQLSKAKKNEEFRRICKKSRCEICEHIVCTDNFNSAATHRNYFIRMENLKRSSKNILYLFTCKTYSKKHTGTRITA